MFFTAYTHLNTGGEVVFSVGYLLSGRIHIRLPESKAEFFQD